MPGNVVKPSYKTADRHLSPQKGVLNTIVAQTLDRMEEYDKFVARFKNQERDPNIMPPSYEHWAMGYTTGFYSMPGRIDGLQGKEGAYTWESWEGLTLPWKEDGRDACEQILANFARTGFVWSENAGTGKTGYVIATARRLAQEKRKICAVIRCPEMNTTGFKELREILLGIERYHVVVLDDINRLKLASDIMADWWHALSDMLCRNERTVLITSNISYPALCRSVGRDCAPAFDRLRAGGLVEIQATGQSLRT